MLRKDTDDDETGEKGEIGDELNRRKIEWCAYVEVFDLLVFLIRSRKSLLVPGGSWMEICDSVEFYLDGDRSVLD